MEAPNWPGFSELQTTGVELDVAEKTFSMLLFKVGLLPGKRDPLALGGREQRPLQGSTEQPV